MKSIIQNRCQCRCQTLGGSVESGSPGSDEVLAGFSCFSNVVLALLMALVLSLMGPSDGPGPGGGSGLVGLMSDSRLNPE